MIQIRPIEFDVTGMSDAEVLFRFGEYYGFKEIAGRRIAQVGYIQKTK